MRDVTMLSSRRRRFVGAVSWIMFVAWLALCIGSTVWVIANGRDPAGLIIVWPLLLFMAIGPVRSLHQRSLRRRDAGSEGDQSGA